MEKAPHYAVVVLARLFGKTERVAQLTAERGWLWPVRKSQAVEKCIRSFVPKIFGAEPRRQRSAMRQ